MAHIDSSRPARPLAPDGTLPDPTRVFTASELCEQLNRLRSRGADGRPRHRVSLSELSRLTGIPRSTVHTYLSGGTLPGADALDAIVLALGCGHRQARGWAEAWCRVTEGGRGSGVRSRSESWSKFAALDHEVRRAMTRATDRWYDLSRPTAIAERVLLGADGRIAHADFRLTIRALEDGVDRWALRLPPGPSVRDPRDVEIVDTQNCVVGAHRFVEGARVRVFELLLGGKLLAGETHQLEFRLDYRAASRAHTLWPVEVRDRCVDVMRGFRRQGPAYSLEVCFAAHQRPCGIRQIQLHAVDAPENTVRPLRLNAWHRVGISLESPVAGLHGIRWSWPED